MNEKYIFYIIIRSLIVFKIVWVLVQGNLSSEVREINYNGLGLKLFYGENSKRNKDLFFK